MLFELGHVPMPEGYGDAILSLDACKAHLQLDAEITEFDGLIGALRDAAIEYVERYCGTKLGATTGLTWQAEGLPSRVGDAVRLSIRPVTAITAISWRASDGEEVTGTADDFRVKLDGRVLPKVGSEWPSSVAGDVTITFTAGYGEGAAPPALLSAVRLMLGHLFMNRDAVVSGTAGGEVPLGVMALCSPYRMPVI